MDKKVMYNLTYGVFALSARDEKDNACIINTAMQVTSSPNVISITVSKQNLTHDMIFKTHEFNLTILSQEVSRDFIKTLGFRSGKDGDKLSDQNCKRAANGIVYFTEGANAFMSGKVINSVDMGSHTVFFAEVTDGEILSQQVALTYDYYRQNFKDEQTENVFSGYRCRICGYVYQGNVLPPDFVCPLCKHGSSDFEKI